MLSRIKILTSALLSDHIAIMSSLEYKVNFYAWIYNFKEDFMTVYYCTWIWQDSTIKLKCLNTHL